ncbi:MAG: glycoside hydrolase family 3 C-terminal domain-containing protein [Tepidisphaeraceae bacterium]
MRKSLNAAVAFLVLGPAELWAQTTAPSATTPPAILAQDTKGTPDERADQLIAEMTQTEKIQLLSGGQGGYATRPIPRVGINAFVTTDGPNGVRNGPGNPTPRACAFPCGAALAATWNPDLAAAYGKAIGLENRARGSNFQLGPGLNICRVPVNGRNFEYFGEDPYLASIVAVNWVKACTATGAVPTIKHFAGNNQETNRNSVDAQIDERTLNEIYLPAFKKAAMEGGNIAVMCSYNRLNGSYASNNDWLLNQTLKKAWGFQGLVMSDWGASHSTSDLAKGLDLEMPSGANLSVPKVEAALADGTVTQANIDGAVHRILRTAFAAGWLDAGFVQKDTTLPMDSPDSVKTALDVAKESIVLLKNDRDTLPLDRTKVKTIVVVGPNATAAEGAVPINIGGGGSGAVMPFAERFADADYLKGITNAAGAGVKVIYLPMPDENNPDSFNLLANAKTAADGEAGLTLTVDVTGAGDPVQIAPTVQKTINTTWQIGQLPFGVPAGRDATFTWSGVLAPPADGDYEIRSAGGPTVTIDGKTIASGSILHLQKDHATPVSIQLQALANPLTGRGRRGGGGGGGGGGGRGRGRAMPMVRVAITPPLIPDLSPAKDADAAICCVGLNRNVEAEGRDRPFELPDIQQYLITSVCAANSHSIIINNSGAGVGMTNWAQGAAAIVHAWYLGQEGGIAIGQALFGDFDPSGRLVSTFDKKFEDNPAYAYYPGATPPGGTYAVEPYTEGIFYGYRGYDKAGAEPMFPFGFGLSYTTFELANMTVEKTGSDVSVSLDVRNTGQREGAEVVQIYVGEQNCPVPRPLRELKGFTKTDLQPGQTERVRIVLPHDSFAYWSPQRKDWTVDSGNTFTIEAAVSERDVRLKQAVTVE